MNTVSSTFQNTDLILGIAIALGVAIFIVWSIVWKAFALWAAARNNQKWWFLALMVINTVGILEIIYLLYFKKDRNEGSTNKRL